MGPFILQRRRREVLCQFQKESLCFDIATCFFLGMAAQDYRVVLVGASLAFSSFGSG